MYGMVNKAIRTMVLEQHGSAAWEAVALKAGLSEDIFHSTEGYPDSITYSLVGAASEVLKVSPTEVLREFGKYWILVTAKRSYADLLSSGGRTLEEFLINLPNFHNRISLIFPHLQPPMFATHAKGPGRLSLEYRSSRPGLAPFVEGLLQGLGMLYATPISAQHTPRAEGREYDLFEIEIGS